MAYKLPRDLTILDVCGGERACLDIEKLYDPYDATCKDCYDDAQEAMGECNETARLAGEDDARHNLR